jgi:outer membrane protein assembly factor BamB
LPALAVRNRFAGFENLCTAGFGLMDSHNRFSAALFLLVTASLAGAAPIKDDDWPWWRGPQRNGHAHPDQKLPAKLDGQRDLLWEAEVPGRGHGSPIIVGERVYLVTADEKAETQSLLAYDRRTGQAVWKSEIHRGGLPPKINKKATHASNSPAFDGERLYVTFVNGGAAQTTAVSLQGDKLWTTKITDYVVHQGYGASPQVYKSLLLVSADNKKAGAVCGLDRASGDIVWKVERPKIANYVSPIVHHLDGRDQLVLSGCEKVMSLNPMTGKTLWETKGSTQETVSSIVTDGARIFVSGGWPKNHVHAVEADGSGKVAWRNISRVYVPSMLVHEGYLYAVMDGGAAMCWNCKTGERQWKGLLGGTYYSSPVLLGDRIHVISENGEYSEFKADPAKFERVHRAQIGEQVFATPVVCGGRFYARVAEFVDDVRKEKLLCLGARSK